MHDVIKSCMSKRSIHRPMDFNVTEYKKFIDMVLDSILQPTFKSIWLDKF